MPVMEVPKSDATVCAAMKPANTAMTATRPTLRANFAATGPDSSTMVLNSTNAAMNTLKIAPMSAPCMTLTPIARPASAQRIQRVSAGVSGVLDTTSASAK